nr:CHAD domain-containing protein [Pseudomonas sp.]
KGWVPEPGAELQDGARYYFGEFGSARDADVLNETVVPQLVEAGMPPVAIPRAEAADAAGVARSPAFQLWLLDLLAFTAGLGVQDQAAPESQFSLKRQVTRRLRKWHGRILADGKHFVELEDEAKHELRKLAKRLRYGLTLTQSLYAGHNLKAYKKSLSALQDVLGEINDLVVARERYAELAHAEPHAWFAVGWTTARLSNLYDDAQASIGRLADTRPFWR